MKNIFCDCVTPWQVVGFDLLRYLQIFFARYSFFQISNSRKNCHGNKFRSDICPSLRARNAKYYPRLFFGIFHRFSIFSKSSTVQRNRRCEAHSNRGCGQPQVDFFFSRVALYFYDDYYKDDDHPHI